MTLSLKLDTANPNFLFFDSAEGFILNISGHSLKVSREDAESLAEYIILKNSGWRDSKVDKEIERLSSVR